VNSLRFILGLFPLGLPTVESGRPSRRRENENRIIYWHQYWSSGPSTPESGSINTVGDANSALVLRDARCSDLRMAAVAQQSNRTATGYQHSLNLTACGYGIGQLR